MPKVRFTLTNVHYAVIDDNDGADVYGTPVHVPGSVALALDPQGEMSKFYADGVVYWQGNNNNGYQGDYETANFPDKMLVDIWNMVENADGVILETKDQEPKRFALLFRIEGDSAKRDYCLYNCLATRPGQGANTQTETKTPQTQKCTISAVPGIGGAIMAKTSCKTKTDVLSGWYKQVYLPTKTDEANA